MQVQTLIEGIILPEKRDKSGLNRSVLFESIFENSMDAILLSKLSDGTILMANPAACKMFGMTLDELRKARRTDIVVMKQKTQLAIDQRNNTGRTRTELTFRRKDGSTFQGELTSSAFTDMDGTKKASLVIRDITEHKKIEQTLRENQDRLELAQHIANLGSWEFRVKSDEAIWSKQLYDMFGLDPETKAPNVMEYSKLIHPDDSQDVSAKMQKFLSEAKLGDTIGFDYCIVTSRGLKDIHTERMVIEVEDGKKPSRIIGIEQDITERKKQEESLYCNQELLTNIINSTDLAIFARDLDERLILLNKTQALTYRMPQNTAFGTTPYDIYPKEVADQIIAWDKKVLTEGKSFQFEETLFINGKLRTYVTNKFPLKDSKGKVYGLGAVIADITERKKMEQQLEQYSKSLEALVEERTNQLKEKERLAGIGETAGMIGHDIRNPLQAIVSELYLARNAIAEAKCQVTCEALESFDFIQEQADYISKIVQDLQDYARPLKPEFQEVNLSDILVNIFSTVAVPDKIKLNVHVKGTLNAKTDPTFMKRALTNLINNAVQAMPDGGELNVMAYEKEKLTIITVGDTGVGIPQNVKPLIFKPLMTTKAKGQGLGLAVVKRLVEALGGKVEFKSQEGKGTTFTMELPRL